MEISTLDQKCRPGNKTQLSWVNWDERYWATELTLLIRSQFSLRLNCYEMLWLYIDKEWLQGIPQNFCCNYPKNSLSLEFSISICSLAADDPFPVVLMIQSFTTGFVKLSVLCAQSFFPSQDSLPVLCKLFFFTWLNRHETKTIPCTGNSYFCAFSNTCMAVCDTRVPSFMFQPGSWYFIIVHIEPITNLNL